jgi:hypothetical protein
MKRRLRDEPEKAMSKARILKKKIVEWLMLSY